MGAEEKKKWPLVSVITVNYNQTKVTEEFLFSFAKITYPETEIFVVDNNTKKEAHAASLKEKFPYIHFIQNKINLGFAGGNNVALPHCKGKYILFINNDTEVEKGFLEPMVDLLESNKAIGMVSPKIRYFHSNSLLQFAGFTPFNMITIRNFAVGYREKDKGQHDDIKETGSVFGAAMMVPAEVIEQLGPMSEMFFLYYEEHDWAAKIKKAGYKVYYCGKSLVYHKESVSTVKDSPFQLYYLTRGRILFARRNNIGVKKVLSFFYVNLVVLPRLTFGYLFKGRVDLIWAVWRAWAWNFLHSKRD